LHLPWFYAGFLLRRKEEEKMKKNGESLSKELSDELLEYLKTKPEFNQDLGTPKDPRFDSYTEFLKKLIPQMSKSSNFLK
jgi:hypothetical protein